MHIFTVLLLSAASVAFSQTSTSSSSPSDLPLQVPSDQVVYKHLFRHVAAFASQADQRQQEGQSAEPFRHYFRRKLSLNPEEELDLTTISLDYVQQLEPIKAQVAAVLAAWHMQYPPGPTEKALWPTAPPAELAGLKAQEAQVLQQHMNQWQDAAGERYTVLHARILKAILPNIHVSQGGSQK